MSKPNTRAIIDTNIRQNGQELITGQVLNATLQAMVTDYAEQAALDGLNQKVNALALGEFYGYFPNSNSLPTDVTKPGYAYVGSDNPYEIWNFNGVSWSDSGTSIDMNDTDEEDITRNTEGKLQFKDRSYGDGMGYIILRKGKTLAEQVTEENTIYEVRYDFSISTDLTLPDNIVFKFVGGAINGQGKIFAKNISIIDGNFANKGIETNGRCFVINSTFDCSLVEENAFMVKALKGDCIIERCLFKNVSYGAIWTEYDNDVLIKNNVIEGTYTEGISQPSTYNTIVAGIFFSAGKKSVTISENTISNINGCGIKSLLLADDISCNISSNHILKTRYGGIVIASTNVRGVIISKNKIVEANLGFVAGETNIFAFSAAINLHGSPNAIITDNEISKSRCLSIDVEGSDDTALREYIESHPTSTIDEQLRVFQSRGTNVLVCNNSINRSMGIAISSCYGCKVVDNVLVRIVSINEISCGICISNSSDTIVENNLLDVRKEKDLGISASDISCISCVSSIYQLDDIYCDFTTATIHSFLYGNEIRGTRSSTALIRTGEVYVTIRDNKQYDNAFYHYAENANGTPYVTNENDIVVSLPILTNSEYIRVDALDNMYLRDVIVSSYDAINDANKLTLGLLRIDLNVLRETPINNIPQGGRVRLSSVSVLGKYWKTGQILCRLIPSAQELKYKVVTFVFEPETQRRYY